MIGKTLLHYEVIEKLGEGGMGEVYRARDSKLGRDVAIKILPEEMYGNPERRKRFEREARVVAALNHPNIVTIHSVEEVAGHPFLTMELVKGKTLRDKIPDGGSSLGMFFSIAVPLVDAVCSAHAQGITHRDLKPANIMINDEGRLKVLDFGLAKLFQEAIGVEDGRTLGADSNTEAGRILGTVSYMSPEQVEGKALDGRSDIFSLGIIFYEMLTGSRPFAGDSNASTISAILRDTPPLVTEIRQTLPHHLGRIIRRCLAKEPGRRYQSALDLRNDLQELAEEVDSGDVAVESTAGDGSDAPPLPTGSRSISSDSIVLPGTRRTYRWVLGVVGLLVVVAIGTVILKTRRSGDAPARFVATDAGAATIGVVGFENLSDPDDSDNLGRVLMGLVTTGLAESGGLNVASTAKVLAAKRDVGAEDRAFDASMAPNVARSAGADVMLVGQVIRDGDRMILTAELVDVGSGNTLGSIKKEAASSSELFELAGAIAGEVRDLMGVTTRGEKAKEALDLARSLTGSPEAYRQYTAGEVTVQQGRYDQAVERFGQAIRIDSTFALAYLKILLAYTWNGETDKGLAAAERGLPFVSRLPERWQVVYRANVDYYEGDVESAYDKIVRLVETNPDIPDAYNLLGEITTHYSRYRDSRRARECFERALEIDPTFEVVFYHLVAEYVRFHDIPALKDLIRRYRDRDPSDPRVASAELVLMQAQQKFGEAAARIDEEVRGGDFTHSDWLGFSLEALGDWERSYQLSLDGVERGGKGYFQAFAHARRGCSQFGRGNLHAGITDMDTACDKLKALGKSGRWSDAIVSGYRSFESYVLSESGDFDGAIAAAERGIREDPYSTWAQQSLLHCQLRAGRTAAAEKTFRELKKIQEGNRNPQDAFVAALAEAELETARGQTEAALAALREAGSTPPELRHEPSQWWIEGEVKSSLGDIAGAAASYRKVLGTTALLAPGDLPSIGVFRIPIHYKLARLDEESGQLEEAKRHYRAYLDRWGNADVAIPNVDDARKRLQALERM